MSTALTKESTRVPRPDRWRPIIVAGFWILLAAWTWKLLEPRPVPEAVIEGLRGMSDSLPFLAAKTLHMLGYAILAGLLWAWVPTRGWRRVAVGLLLLHGVGTEIGQTFVPNRTGKVSDVLIDWVGITAGTLAVRRLEQRSLRPE